MQVMLDINICITSSNNGLPQSSNASCRNRLERSAFQHHGSHLAYGVSKSRHASKNYHALEKFLGPLEIAPFDLAAAWSYGRLRGQLEATGTPIGSMDMLIAAHALSLEVRLVSNNIREFRRVPGL
jgi:tRNA(fMet)-specific endonuclease VapC